MYEKILQKLKKQRDELHTQKGTKSNVSDRSLGDLAKSLETVITTDEILEKADFSNSIASIDGNINHYTAEQVNTAKTDAVEAYKKAEAERIQKEKDDKAKGNKTDNKDDDEPDVAKIVQDAIKPLVEKINSFENKEMTQTRSQILEEKLKDTPTIFRNATLSGFNRMNFKDDEEFNTYISEIEESAKAAIQEGAEKGLNTATPSSDIKPPDPEEVSPEMKKAIETITEVKEDDKPF
jgi:hypothetical protein